jgi:hypothetical protein
MLRNYFASYDMQANSQNSPNIKLKTTSLQLKGPGWLNELDSWIT